MFSAERLDAINTASPQADPLLEALGATMPAMSPPVALALTTALCMIGAFFLMLPVSWVYILTRQKKGFRQSVVQTLIILPIVVAGVVLLVKNSIALAFSLGGIVAAVSFRNTLRDTKDAVYIFLAIGVGLAAGVQVMSAAAVMSFLFNVLILVFWYTDFGRAPSHLEGPRAARRLERSLALANRTGAFVAQLDQEILKSMSPEQLQALASASPPAGGRGRHRRPTGPRPRSRPSRWTPWSGSRAPTPRTRGHRSKRCSPTQVKEWKFYGTQRDATGSRRAGVPRPAAEERAGSRSSAASCGPGWDRGPPRSRRGNHRPA